MSDSAQNEKEEEDRPPYNALWPCRLAAVPYMMCPTPARQRGSPRIGVHPWPYSASGAHQLLSSSTSPVSEAHVAMDVLQFPRFQPFYFTRGCVFDGFHELIQTGGSIPLRVTPLVLGHWPAISCGPTR